MCSSNSISWLYLTLRAQISYACKGVKILCVSRLLKRSARMLGQGFGFRMRAGLRVIEGQNDDSLSLSEHLNLVNSKLEEVGSVQCSQISLKVCTSFDLTASLKVYILSMTFFGC